MNGTRNGFLRQGHGPTPVSVQQGPRVVRITIERGQRYRVRARYELIFAAGSRLLEQAGLSFYASAGSAEALGTLELISELRMDSGRTRSWILLRRLTAVASGTRSSPR
jgi:hypothetical protein